MSANTVASATIDTRPAPRDRAFDSTLSLLREGYEFIGNRCRDLRTDIFVTRLLGKRVVCLQGRHAAAVFYDEQRFQRAGAVPRRVVTSLFGKGGVQGLDGSTHRRRKELFLSLMSQARLQNLLDLTEEEFRLAVANWQGQAEVVLFDEVSRLLTRAVCRWAGVPLPPQQVAARARDFTDMVDAFGGVGPRLWKGKLARARAEAWIRSVIRAIRSPGSHAEPLAAAHVIAAHRDELGALLPEKIAAVELINLLRPTVAITWYVTFAALALREHPAVRERLTTEPGAFEANGYAHRFIQEVRRFYPFTPFVGAKVKQAFEWNGHHFSEGQLALLDVYGSLRDPEVWTEPERFRPDRFQNWQGTAYDFIPQGGGPLLGHRCAGEWITLQTLAVAVRYLTCHIDYEVVADQDLSLDLSRMPTAPNSGFVLRRVRRLGNGHSSNSPRA
jgi:fatty-acid peroxygenase